MLKRRLYDYPLWNIFLLTIGGICVTISVQSVAAPHGFLTGGVMGLSLLANYIVGLFPSTTWNLFFNIPLLLFSLLKVSRSFVLYSIYGTVIITIVGIVLEDFVIPIQDPLYASILSGFLFGLGGGLMLRTRGSSGGLDLIAVYIYQKWNIQVGSSIFAFNVFLFSLSLTTISVDLVIISFIQIFIVKQVTNYVMTLFNQRKMVFVVTSKGQEICYAIAEQGGRTTILPAYGGYSHEAKEIVMTITTNATLRSLEELVFRYDPQAIFSVENTFYVAGGQYRKELK